MVWYDFETVASIITRYALLHENRLDPHVNEEASKVLNMESEISRLKRTKPFQVKQALRQEG